MKKNKYWTLKKIEDIDWSDEEEYVPTLRYQNFLYYEDKDEHLESFYEEFMTPLGETIVAFGEYGDDY